ncbi:MAG: FMN-binding protein [Bacteroidales bacterium]|nr:FMN-binding protein [Bacteroidales bacterium]
MNTNSNIYTVIYTTIIVVVVAALLSFVSQSLKGKQEANEKADTISQMMTAAGFGTKPEFQKIGNAAVLERYAEEIESAYTVDIEGNKVSDLPLDKVYSPSELKKQNYNIKGAGDAELPVFEFKNGITVVPIYGAGLWGPVWGYIAFNKPEGGVISIKGAYFDHESETAGLGARIKDDPAFQGEFAGEMPEFGSSNVFDIVKGGSPKNDDGSELLDNKIDAITGATMTSQGLEAAIDTWLGAYSKHFQAGMAIVTILESLEDQASVETEETKKEEE